MISFFLLAFRAITYKHKNTNISIRERGDNKSKINLQHSHPRIYYKPKEYLT